MATIKEALYDVLEQSIDDEGLDTIQPSAEALDVARTFASYALDGIDDAENRPISDLELKRFAVGIDRFQAPA